MSSDAAGSMVNAEPIPTPPAIEIRPLLPGDDATAFRTLNEEWITRHFTMEAKDVETLGDPVNSILRKGGFIFMVYADAEPVGCVAPAGAVRVREQPVWAIHLCQPGDAGGKRGRACRGLWHARPDSRWQRRAGRLSGCPARA